MLSHFTRFAALCIVLTSFVGCGSDNSDDVEDQATAEASLSGDQDSVVGFYYRLDVAYAINSSHANYENGNSDRDPTHFLSVGNPGLILRPNGEGEIYIDIINSGYTLAAPRNVRGIRQVAWATEDDSLFLYWANPVDRSNRDRPRTAKAEFSFIQKEDTLILKKFRHWDYYGSYSEHRPETNYQISVFDNDKVEGKKNDWMDDYRLLKLDRKIVKKSLDYIPGYDPDYRPGFTRLHLHSDAALLDYGRLSVDEIMSAFEQSYDPASYTAQFTKITDRQRREEIAEEEYRYRLQVFESP